MRVAKLLAALLILPSPLFAWTTAMNHRIASKGAQLAPPDMRLVIDRYRDEYDRSVTDAGRDETSAVHRFNVADGTGKLKGQLDAEVRNAVTMLRARKPLPQVVARLGVIAHLVADANNPLHVAFEDARLDAECGADFESYAETRLPAFPTVFYGLADHFDLSRYLDDTVARTAKLYPLLDEEYFRFGERHSSDEFDDRSTAFGVASVSYSHAVTDLANVFYYIWKEAGGDVRSVSAMREGTLLLNGTALQPEQPFLGRAESP